MNIDLQIVLVITSPNLKSPGDTKIALLDEASLLLPTVKVDGSTNLTNLAANCLKKYSGLEARIEGRGWIDLIQTPVIHEQERGIITIPYGCMIPNEVDLKEGAKWLTVMNLFSQPQHQNNKSLEIIKNVCLSL